MSAGARVGAFVALLALIFAGAALLGGALDPDGGGDGGGHGASAASHEDEPAAAAPGADHGDRDGAAAGHEDEPAAPAGADHGDEDEPAGAAPAGVASAQDGLRLVVQRTRFAPGRPASLRFRIVDTAGDTVRAFDLEQARRMHVIVVRRDLRRYQHLHPEQDAGGAWTTPLTLPDAGVYRAFADFRRSGEQHTLGIDLVVPGNFEPLDLPAPATTAGVDGYDVGVHARGARELSFAVGRDGRPVSDLQPYLGARGHLVMLRDGDLAYRHVHPIDSEPGTIAFDTGASEPGSYRMFLQFRHRNRVHTAAFTRIVKP